MSEIDERLAVAEQALADMISEALVAIIGRSGPFILLTAGDTQLHYLSNCNDVWAVDNMRKMIETIEEKLATRRQKLDS